MSTSKQSGLAEDLAQGVRDSMMTAADAGFAKSQAEVPVGATSGLKQSGVAPQWDGDALVWGYTSEYAEWVEDGTDPRDRFPLKGGGEGTESIQLWARRVLGDESLWYPVARKIKEEGTDPQPFVEPGIKEMRRYLRQNSLSDRVKAERSGGEP